MVFIIAMMSDPKAAVPIWYLNVIPIAYEKSIEWEHNLQ